MDVVLDVMYHTLIMMVIGDMKTIGVVSFLNII